MQYVSAPLCSKCAERSHSTSRCISKDRKCVKCHSAAHTTLSCAEHPFYAIQPCHACKQVGHVSSQCPESEVSAIWRDFGFSFIWIYVARQCHLCHDSNTIHLGMECSQSSVCNILESLSRTYPHYCGVVLFLSEPVSFKILLSPPSMHGQCPTLSKISLIISQKGQSCLNRGHIFQVCPFDPEAQSVSCHLQHILVLTCLLMAGRCRTLSSFISPRENPESDTHLQTYANLHTQPLDDATCGNSNITLESSGSQLPSGSRHDVIVSNGTEAVESKNQGDLAEKALLKDSVEIVLRFKPTLSSKFNDITRVDHENLILPSELLSSFFHTQASWPAPLQKVFVTPLTSCF